MICSKYSKEYVCDKCRKPRNAKNEPYTITKNHPRKCIFCVEKENRDLEALKILPPHPKKYKSVADMKRHKRYW